MSSRQWTALANCVFFNTLVVMAVEDVQHGTSHGSLYLPAADPSPIKVVGVTGDITKGIGWPVVLSESDRIPKTMELGWYIRVGLEAENSFNTGHVIRGGKTNPVMIHGLTKGRRHGVDTLVVTYEEVERVLREAGITGKPPLVGIAVDEITFHDGSSWTRSNDAR